MAEVEAEAEAAGVGTGRRASAHTCLPMDRVLIRSLGSVAICASTCGNTCLCKHAVNWRWLLACSRCRWVSPCSRRGRFGGGSDAESALARPAGAALGGLKPGLDGLVNKDGSPACGTAAIWWIWRTVGGDVVVVTAEPMSAGAPGRRQSSRNPKSHDSRRISTNKKSKLKKNA